MDRKWNSRFLCYSILTSADHHDIRRKLNDMPILTLMKAESTGPPSLKHRPFAGLQQATLSYPEQLLCLIFTNDQAIGWFELICLGYGIGPTSSRWFSDDINAPLGCIADLELKAHISPRVFPPVSSRN